MVNYIHIKALTAYASIFGANTTLARNKSLFAFENFHFGDEIYLRQQPFDEKQL